MHSLAHLSLALTLLLQAVWCAPTGSGACVAGPISGTTCEAQCGADHAGGDYAALPASTFQACANACSSDTRCVTAQWDNRGLYCYLKSVLNQAVSSSNVDSVICRACPSGNLRIQLITPSGRVRYLLNTGEIGSTIRDGQVMAYEQLSDSTAYYLNGTVLTSSKPQSDGAKNLVYTWPGDAIAYATTPARNNGYDLLEVKLTQNLDKCKVSFRTPKGNTVPSIYSDNAGGGVAFFISPANSNQYVPVTAYALAA